MLALVLGLAGGAFVPIGGATAGAVTGRAGANTTANARSAARPNILFVLADDLDLASLAAMPEVQALVADHGATFDDYFVSDSLCCPSRTTTLRGQYAHNTGVESNGGSNGGFRAAHRRGLERSTIATRLQAAGYRTGLFGKYLNGYPGNAGLRYRPPGWDTWASPVDGAPYSEYDYTLNHDGRLEQHGSAPEDYGTDVYAGLARRFVERSVAKGRPFFAYVAPFVPHLPATPAPADVDRFPGVTAPRTPSFDQADVTAMPTLIRNLPHLSEPEIAAIDRLQQRRIESLQALDRGVADLIGALRSLGALRDTYVVFASDNGFHLGQHRLPAGKETPYDTDVHVPLVVRGPGIDSHRHVTDMAGNVDLAPTFAAMAGLGPLRRDDGRSLLGLLHGHAAARPRRTTLVEHWALRHGGREPSFVPFGGMLEPTDPDQATAEDARLHPTVIADPEPRHSSAAPLLSDSTLYAAVTKIPDYAGVRTDRYLYVEYVNGDRELYDLATDPDEMHNLAGTRPDVEAALAARVAALRSCRGRACRVADSAAVPGV